MFGEGIDDFSIPLESVYFTYYSKYVNELNDNTTTTQAPSASTPANGETHVNGNTNGILPEQYLSNTYFYY